MLTLVATRRLKHYVIWKSEGSGVYEVLQVIQKLEIKPFHVYFFLKYVINWLEFYTWWWDFGENYRFEISWLSEAKSKIWRLVLSVYI